MTGTGLGGKFSSSAFRAKFRLSHYPWNFNTHARTHARHSPSSASQDQVVKSGFPKEGTKQCKRVKCMKKPRDHQKMSVIKSNCGLSPSMAKN